MIGDDWIVSIKSTNFNSNSCLISPHSKQPPSLLSGTQYKYSLHHNQWNLGKKNIYIYFYSSEASSRPNFHKAVIYSYANGTSSVMRCNHHHIAHFLFLLLGFSGFSIGVCDLKSVRCDAADTNGHKKKPVFSWHSSAETIGDTK